MNDREVPPEQVALWEQETAGAFTHHVLPGGHFMITTGPETILRTIRERLAG